MATTLSIFILNLLGVGGIIVWHLQGRSRPTERLVVQIVFFVAMTSVLAYGRVSPFQFDASQVTLHHPFFVSAKILWWTHMAWATVGLVRIYLVLDGRPREARLIQDLMVAAIYVGVLLSVMAFVFGVPIGTLLATSGIVAIIMGLALQNTLSDVFSGIALTLGRPYVIGDWILLTEGMEGRVVESNWRSTSILTSAQNLVVLPNSILAKQALTNVSRPEEIHQLTLPVRLVPNKRPRFVMDVLREALNNCNNIVQLPAPTVSLTGITGAAIEVEVLFRVRGPSQRVVARNEVIDLIYQHCKFNGLTLAKPVENLIVEKRGGNDEVLELSAEKLFETAPLLVNFTKEERSALAASATKSLCAAGGTVQEKGQRSDAITFIGTGIVSLSDDIGEVTRLAPGDFLGLRSVIAGDPELYDAKALTAATFFEVPRAEFKSLVLKRPPLFNELAEKVRGANVARTNSGRPIISPGAKADLIHTLRSAFASRDRD